MGLASKRTYKEEELVEYLLSGDTNRFGAIYDHFAPYLLGIIAKIVKNEKQAEDILQETFLKAWKSSKNYDPKKGRVFTWMLNLARNSAIDYTRSKQGKIEQKLDPVDKYIGVNEPYTQHIGHDHIGLKKLVDGLKGDHHEIINLSFFEGYSQAEIAEKLQIPLGTVKTRCRSALHVLRKGLAENS